MTITSIDLIKSPYSFKYLLLCFPVHWIKCIENKLPASEPDLLTCVFKFKATQEDQLHRVNPLIMMVNGNKCLSMVTAKIGGWLGIINGSSIISVAELFILFFIFLFRIVAGRTESWTGSAGKTDIELNLQCTLSSICYLPASWWQMLKCKY